MRQTSSCSRWGDAIERLSDLTSNATAVDYLDTDWQVGVGLQLGILKVFNEEIQKLSPPPALETLHSYLTQALALFAQSADNLAYGIDNLDAYSVEVAASQMTQGAEFLDLATAELGR